jgi:hypothetical protein
MVERCRPLTVRFAQDNVPQENSYLQAYNSKVNTSPSLPRDVHPQKSRKGEKAFDLCCGSSSDFRPIKINYFRPINIICVFVLFVFLTVPYL